MYLFAGLGNIGKEYESTRHNLGFICVDKIIEKYGYKDKKDKFNATIFSTVIDEKIVLIVKPNTYMNRSGIAISQIKSFYKIPLENIFVFHDDLDLSLGKIKFKIGGSSAGHNGLKSIDQFIGNNYARIRLGIGRPNNKNDIVDFVFNFCGQRVGFRLLCSSRCAVLFVFFVVHFFPFPDKTKKTISTGIVYCFCLPVNRNGKGNYFQP